MGRFIFVGFGLLVVFLSLSGTGADPSCPPDWTPFKQSCYQVFKQPMNWMDAERECMKKAEGGHLASILSRREKRFVGKLASKHAEGSNVWIGLKGRGKQFQERNWEWSDGSPFGYKSWKLGEPNNDLQEETCVELWRLLGYLTWNDEDCESRRYFICKFQPQG